MGHPIRIRPEMDRKTFTDPTHAYIQHIVEVGSVHWPHKELGGKGKAGKPSSNVKPPFSFSRQTAAAPNKAHRVAYKKKFTA